MKNPTGFVGKFLKKHRDLKLKAQEKVALAEKEKHDKMVQKMNEAIASPKKAAEKRKKMGFAARAEQKLKDEAEKA